MLSVRITMRVIKSPTSCARANHTLNYNEMEVFACNGVKMQMKKKDTIRYAKIQCIPYPLKWLNEADIHVHYGRSFGRRVKPNTFLNSTKVGDQADILLIAKTLFFEKSIIFHLHFRRHKFSFPYLKMA